MIRKGPGTLAARLGPGFAPGARNALRGRPYAPSPFKCRISRSNSPHPDRSDGSPGNG